MPVVTLEGGSAAVRGDAMIAGVAVGVFDDLPAASSAMVALQDRYEPNPATRIAYDDAYGRYLRLFDTLRPLFTKTGLPT